MVGDGVAAVAVGLGGQREQGVGVAWLTLPLPEGAGTLLWLRVLQAGEGRLREEGLLPEGEHLAAPGAVRLRGSEGPGA